jgi:3D (Asp-Asp-Asp) domain-containing protein
MYRYLIRSRHGRWTRRCDDCIALFILTVFCLAFAVLVWNALRIEPTGIIIAPVEAMERPHVPCHKVAPGHTVCGTPEDIAKWNAWLESENARKTLTKTVTGYNSVRWQTDSTPCISADGSDICALEAKGDHSCAASLPFGTRLHIPGLGICTVRDRLAKKYADRVDWHFGGADKVQEARAWGKRTLSITIL